MVQPYSGSAQQLPAPENQQKPVDEDAPSDGDLVERARTGDQGAFELLVARYKSLVSVVAFRQLGSYEMVEDVAQEAFVKAFIHLTALDESNSFKSWLLKITANLALDHLRKRKHQSVSLDQSGGFAVAESAAAASSEQKELLTDRNMQQQELRAQIVEAIYSLPVEYQMPAAMRYLEDATYKEISETLGIREETLRKRIHRANQMLRQKLKKLMLEE